MEFKRFLLSHLCLQNTSRWGIGIQLESATMEEADMQAQAAVPLQPPM